MIRVGKKPLAIPSGVTATVEGQIVKLKGPKGALAVALHGDVAAMVQGSEVKVDPRADTKRARPLWGTYRWLRANPMTGVTRGCAPRPGLIGAVYLATLQGPDR